MKSLSDFTAVASRDGVSMEISAIQFISEKHKFGKGEQNRSFCVRI
jgi:hypothetical protein